jgi:hypothetical protein
MGREVSESTSGTDYKYFPITFNATVYVAIPTSTYKSVVSWISDVTTEKFLCGIGNDWDTSANAYIVSYIAIGQ